MTKRISPLTLALCAACLLVGSTGGAVAGAKITGKQIKNESVTGKDVRNGSLTSKDLAVGTVSGPPGPAGPVGPTGPKGNSGTDGADGVSGYQTLTSTTNIASGNDGSASRTCGAGRSLISASGYLNTVHPVMVIHENATTASAWTEDVPLAATLTVKIVCANVS